MRHAESPDLKTSTLFLLFIGLFIACGPSMGTNDETQTIPRSAPSKALSMPPIKGLEKTATAKPNAAALSCGFSARGAPCTYLVSQLDDQTAEYIIYQPVVNTSGHDYTSIPLIPGDQVKVESAGGCVQTGGSGFNTWKRYVNPASSKGFYYGTVTIRGGIYPVTDPTTGHIIQEPVAGISVSHLLQYDTTLYVGAIPKPTYLTLGYIDDEYDDNGYYEHDDGTHDQCSYDTGDGGPAHIVITVHHASVSDIPGGTNPFDYDIVQRHAMDYDDNLLYLNPEWGWQYDGYSMADPHATYEPSNRYETAQVTSTDSMGAWHTIETADFACPTRGSIGHINWTDVTYFGKIYWEDLSSSDDDADLEFESPEAVCPQGECSYFAGITPGSVDEPLFPGGPPSIHLEFDSNETSVYYFKDINWRTFLNGEGGDLYHATEKLCGNDKVLGCSWPIDPNYATPDQAADLHPTLHDLIDGHEAVAVGLMGLDAVHDYIAEIHPAHAFAVDLSCTPGVQKWMFFIRNWGDEGYCSKNDHLLGLQDFVLDLPRPAGVPDGVAPSLDVDDTSVWIHDGESKLHYYLNPSGPSALKTSLGNPTTHPFVFGTVQLDWGVPTEVPASCSQGGLAATMDVDHPGLSEDDDALFSALGIPELPSNIQDFKRLMPTLIPPKLMPSSPMVLVRSNAPFPRPDHPPTVTSVYSPKKPKADFAAVDALCLIGSGTTPAHPGACIPFPPLTTLTTSGGQQGNNGWSTRSVVATLSARDASGSGVDHSEYSYDQKNWITYTGPFGLSEGPVNLYYRSSDRNGNVEDIRTASFKIDTRPPAAHVALMPSGSGINLAYDITDPQPGSGPMGLYYQSLAPGGDTVKFAPGAHGVVHLNTECTDIMYWAEDIAGNLQTPRGRIRDTTSPDLIVEPTSICLWPPNHALIKFAINEDLSVDVHDVCDPSPSVIIAGIRSNESVLPGDMSYSSNAVCVRRTRNGSGAGRRYTVTISSSDYSGNTSSKDVNIDVPHDMRQHACLAAGRPVHNEEACP